MKGDKSNSTSNNINNNNNNNNSINNSNSNNNNNNSNNIIKLPEDKVPIIRLKLKVPIKVVEAVEQTSTATKSDKIDETNIPQKIHNTPTSSPSSSPNSRSVKFYGTFKYRPFKLFPLLPPSSRYRVLIPSKHTHLHLNPAIKLHYLWQPSNNTMNGVYTDDSDLVCVLIKEGWFKGENGVKGKDILVEVEVVGTDELENKNEVKNTKMVVNEENDNNHIFINTRSYDNHDGHYIRIITCTVDPSTVHLKHWRKRKPTTTTTNNHLVTPKFKTKT